MRFWWWAGLAALGAAGCWFALRGFWNDPALSVAKPVPAGHQEIAWLAPATGTDAWERLVAALQLLEQDWAKVHGGPDLRVNVSQAFLDLTADVPEIGLSFVGSPDKVLWIRWYKLSGEIGPDQWIGKLRDRGHAPLAILGGETTDRALQLARVLENQRSRWPGSAPVFLITTATAERYYLGEQPNAELGHESWPKLMQLYEGRTFRFCFTNSRMVNSVMDFLGDHPQVWVYRNAEPALFAGLVAQGCPLGSLAVLGGAGYLQAPNLFALDWLDDGYSTDLAEIFLRVFTHQNRADPNAGRRAEHNHVAYSVGDFFQPNASELLAVDLYLDNTTRFQDQPQLLVLPTGAHRARRFLRTLCRRAPEEIRKLVVATGDAITFNTIFRDRDVAWNIQDMPVPLVFFSHRSPIDESAGFGKKDLVLNQLTVTGTQDLLLYRDVSEAVLLAAWQGDRWVKDADLMIDRMRQLQWSRGRIFQIDPEKDRTVGPFFDVEGNRHPRTGEHVVWLQPALEGKRNLARATITVWRMTGQGSEQNWELAGPPLTVKYDRSEGAGLHGDN